MVEERNENLHQADGMNEQEKAPSEKQNQTEEKVEPKLLSEGKENEEEKTLEEVVNEIEEKMASDSEHHEEGHETQIPKIIYSTLDPEKLIEEAKKLVESSPVQNIKSHIDEIIKVFGEKIEIIKEKLEQENEDPVKLDIEKDFQAIINDYKKKLRAYKAEIQEKLENNLERRKAIIEDLKNLIDSTEYTFEQRLKKFKEIQKSWRTAGPIPRNTYTDIWNTYRHHEERFYDLLDLDREYRDKVFQDHLEEKKAIIEEAKKLLNEKDIHYIFVELQKLHKKWKEETGPVSREFRESIWEEFKEVTKQIHDKRREFYKKLKEQFGENLIKKQEIIEKLKEISENLPDNHKNWQEVIKKVEALREEFYQLGFVPKKNREEIWSSFKETLKKINKQKNNFYKSLKDLQKENLEKKQALIKIAEELKESEDWENATKKYKEIQEEWKKIGHVPRKVSDKIWHEFREHCNHYFDRYHKHIKQEKNDEFEIFFKKKEFLQELKEKFRELPEDHNFTIEDIKKIQQEWHDMGYVPKNKQYINAKFNKFINGLFDKLHIDKRELSFLKFKNQIDDYLKNENFYKIDSEKRYVRQKIEGIEKEIQQLENNSMFIKSDDKNNMFKREVEKNIKKNKEILDFWKKKMDYLNSLEY